MHSRLRPSPAMVVALIALFVALGGSAAALSGSNTVFTDDIANDTQPASGGNPAGGLVAADLRPNAVGASETATNSVGSGEIATDAVGSAEVLDFGLSNQDVGVLFAEVNANCTLANSSGGVTLSGGGGGNCFVDFGRDVSACAAVATISNGVDNSGEIIVSDGGGDGESVRVQTTSSAGGSENNGFHLVVVC